MKGKTKITEKERRELEQRKRYWRNFREQKEEFIVDETEVEAGNIDHDVASCNAAASKNIHGKEDFRGKEEDIGRMGSLSGDAWGKPTVQLKRKSR